MSDAHAAPVTENGVPPAQVAEEAPGFKVRITLGKGLKSPSLTHLHMLPSSSGFRRQPCVHYYG